MFEQARIRKPNRRVTLCFRLHVWYLIFRLDEGEPGGTPLL